VLPWFEARKKELANRPLIREQAFGESLDPDKLERLGRYEVHLDRTLAMLLRLKDLRQGAIAGCVSQNQWGWPRARAGRTSLGHTPRAVH
jgi:hypothetical protein